jgi:hypothetical protein
VLQHSGKEISKLILRFSAGHTAALFAREDKQPPPSHPAGPQVGNAWIPGPGQAGPAIMQTGQMTTVWSSADILNLPEETAAVAGANLDDQLVIELLSRCHRLRAINLMGNEELTDTSLTQLANELDLEDIDLGLCHMMSDRTPSALAGLPHLRTLSLAWCYPITDASLVALAQSKTLAKLLLGGCENLTDEGVGALAQMPSLEWLELPEFAEITDKAIEALAAAPKLSNLRLSNLQSVTDAGLHALRAAKNLRTLRIDGASSITFDGVEQLHKDLPECRIKYGSWESPPVASV